ncbi:YjbF family lipoprotein [Cobetia sp. QF-1]|uniref:YjbF family lipoprotein n=1 Tax=Cobetia sp. QF-1 TaxID=1969833 RepID=UPI0011321B16|nr:YjbF family lipoprotein [Cobetia sp. QF-1]
MKPISIARQGRQVALLSVIGSILLVGCSTLEQGQLGQTAGAVMGRDMFDAEQARALPYASLRLSHGGNTGLVVLATLDAPASDASVRQELARFETADHAFIRLENSLLGGTAGFDHDLLDMQRDMHVKQDAVVAESVGTGPVSTGSVDSKPVVTVQGGETSSSTQPWRLDTQHVLHYDVRSRWRRMDGSEGYALGRAEWQCAPARPVALPLGTQSLAECQEKIHWQNGKVSTNHYGVADSNDDSLPARVWTADVQPWPNAPRWSWEVARGWW